MYDYWSRMKTCDAICFHRCPGWLCSGGLAREKPVLDRWREQSDCCRQTGYNHCEVPGPQRHPGWRPGSTSLSGIAATKRVSMTLLHTPEYPTVFLRTSRLVFFNCPPRLMFWTEIGNIVKIERAGMDGSERKAVVNSSLGWPGGVAVDAISDRVYWTDERLRSIGSATLDGEDIRVRHFRTDVFKN